MYKQNKGRALLRPSFISFQMYSKLLCRSWNCGTSVIAHITAQVLDRVDQELHHVLRVMDKCTRVLLGILIVESGSEQLGRPIAIEVHARTLIIRVALAIAIRIQEEVRICSRIVG